MIKFLLVISYFDITLSANGPKFMVFCFLMLRVSNFFHMFSFLYYFNFGWLIICCEFLVESILFWTLFSSLPFSLSSSSRYNSHYCRVCLLSYNLAQSLLLLWYLSLQNKILFSWINCVLLSLFSPYHI